MEEFYSVTSLFFNAVIMIVNLYLWRDMSKMYEGVNMSITQFFERHIKEALKRNGSATGEPQT